MFGDRAQESNQQANQGEHDENPGGDEGDDDDEHECEGVKKPEPVIRVSDDFLDPAAGPGGEAKKILEQRAKAATA